MSKQTAVELIFYNFNLLSDADFKSWMLNKYDELKAMEKQQIVDAHLTGLIHPLEMEATKQAEQYYHETYGGEND